MAAEDTQMVSSRLLCTRHFIKPSTQCPKPYTLLAPYSTYAVIAEAIPRRLYENKQRLIVACSNFSVQASRLQMLYHLCEFFDSDIAV